MAANEASLALTGAYRARVLSLREGSALAAAQAWRGVTLDRLEESFATWQAVVSALTAASKREASAASAGYVAAFVGSELDRLAVAAPFDPTRYEAAVNGRPLAQALATPLFTVKAAIASGRTRDALQLGLARATRLVAVETQTAARASLMDVMREDDHVTAFRRVVSGNACGACLALATGQKLRLSDDFHSHSHCRCVGEPVVAGVRDRFARPTGRQIFDALSDTEQAALFHGRGGAEKADLVRSGAVPFSALVRRDHQAVAPTEYTEASLDDLRKLAAPVAANTDGER